MTSKCKFEGLFFGFVLEEEKEEENEEEEENTLNEPEIQLVQPSWLGARSF